MYQAIWHGTVLAESDETREVEGNQYFPPESIHRDYFKDSTLTSVCPWKGTASYYTVTVDGNSNHDAAWCYPQPSPAAAEIRDYVAFWKGVKVVASSGNTPEAEPRGAGFLSRLMHRTHQSS